MELRRRQVTVTGCTPWHQYTASFLCWRIWEEINMYNQPPSLDERACVS